MTENYFTEKLQDILKEHCPPATQFSIHQIYEHYNEILEDFDRKPWALFGGGGTLTHFYYDFLENHNFENLCCVLDNDPALEGTVDRQLSIYKPEALLELGIESVFILVVKNGDEISKQLKEINPNLNIYQMCDFPSYFMKNMYASIHLDRKKHQEETDPQKAKEFLEIIIASYFSIGDFSNGFLSLEEHIKEYGDLNFILLKEKLETLLKELKEKLSQRTEPDLSLIILDSLLKKDGYDPEKMPFLSQWKEKGAYYEKSYSPGVFTIEATHAIFHQKYGPENEKDNFSKTAKDTKLYQHFMKEGYENNVYHTIAEVGQMSFTVNQIIYNDDSVYKNCFFDRSTPYLFWKMITNLACNPQKQFNLVHTIQESHLHYLGGKHSLDLPILEVFSMKNKEEQERIFEIRCKEALLYLDQQLSFYLPLFPETSTQVITADHGRFKKLNTEKEDIPKLFFWHSSHYHVPLIVTGKFINKQKIDHVFSLFHLPDLLISLEQEGKLFQQAENYARVDFRGWVNQSRRNNDISKGLSGHSDGFICFIDSKYKLIRDSHGVFRYFSMDNEEVEIFDLCLQKEIDLRLGSLF